MKQAWSRKWVSSTQPRKQRKYRSAAPLHVRHRFLSARLSAELSKAHERRSLPVRKGDEVEILRGQFRKLRGAVERVDLKTAKIYIQGAKVKKVDGTEVLRPIDPSNTRITALKSGDKAREGVLSRKKRGTRGKERPSSAQAPKEQKSGE